MSNGHVEIHDPLSNRNDLKSHTGRDPTSTSDAANMEDTPEFRLLVAYATRRRPASPDREGPVALNRKTAANGGSSPHSPAQAETEATEVKEEKKRKKKGWKRVLKVFRCINPQTKDEEPLEISEGLPDVDFRCGDAIEDEDDADDADDADDELRAVANQLIKIANEVPFIPPTLESDAPEDAEVERLIGLLLRDAGDRLNERELKDVAIARELFWDYSFFQRILTTLLTRMGLRSSNPDSPGPHASPKTQMAVACEATTRLSAMNTLPMNRLLGYGARYLNEHYSPWVQQQGGYDAVFDSDEEDEVQ